MAARNVPAHLVIVGTLSIIDLLYFLIMKSFIRYVFTWRFFAINLLALVVFGIIACFLMVLKETLALRLLFVAHGIFFTGTFIFCTLNYMKYQEFKNHDRHVD